MEEAKKYILIIAYRLNDDFMLSILLMNPKTVTSMQQSHELLPPINAVYLLLVYIGFNIVNVHASKFQGGDTDYFCKKRGMAAPPCRGNFRHGWGLIAGPLESLDTIAL